MNDDMNYARTLRDLHEEIEFAASELRAALESAEAGHRGVTVDVAGIINEELEGTGYRLVKE